MTYVAFLAVASFAGAALVFFPKRPATISALALATFATLGIIVNGSASDRPVSSLVPSASLALLVAGAACFAFARNRTHRRPALAAGVALWPFAFFSTYYLVATHADSMLMPAAEIALASDTVIDGVLVPRGSLVSYDPLDFGGEGLDAEIALPDGAEIAGMPLDRVGLTSHGIADDMYAKITRRYDGDGLHCAAGFVSLKDGRIDSCTVTQPVTMDGIACTGDVDRNFHACTLARATTIHGIVFAAGTQYYDGNVKIARHAPDIRVFGKRLAAGNEIHFFDDGSAAFSIVRHTVRNCSFDAVTRKGDGSVVGDGNGCNPPLPRSTVTFGAVRAPESRASRTPRGG